MRNLRPLFRAGGSIVALAAFASAVHPASGAAQTIVTGSSGGYGNDSNSSPFGGDNQTNTDPGGPFNYIGEYQQIYAQTDFTGTVTISSIAFETADTGDPVADPGDSNAPDPVAYTMTASFGYSNTPTATGAVSANNGFNSYESSALTQVFNGTLNANLTAASTNTGTKTSTFDLTIPTSFQYNPSLGNLLFDVNITSAYSSDPNFVDENFWYVDGATDMDTVQDNGTASGGSGDDTFAPHQGLLTQFVVVTSAVPEPSPAIVIALGMVCIGALALRRKSAAKMAA